MTQHSSHVETRRLRRQGAQATIATLTLAVVLLVILAGLSPAWAGQTLHTATGLRVTIHDAESITSRWLEQRDGRTWLRHPAAGSLELDTVQRPWHTLVALSPAVIAEALATMQGFTTDVDVEVFLLPGFPAVERSSFARRNVIFMAPALGQPADQSVAYVVTHEMGHVLTWAALDGRPARWEAYRDLRGLEVQADPARIPHAERNREILAEDLRHLFGGPLATRSGTIENGRLALPETVAGLADLLAGFLAEPHGDLADMAAASRVLANPCRGEARIELVLGAQAAKTGTATASVLEIFDARGRLVRRLAGGQAHNDRVLVTWDGTLEDGRRAAPGTYLYRIGGGGNVGQGKFLLLDR